MATDKQVHEVAGNRLTVLHEGATRLDALLALIARAERELRLLYYIFADDPAGTAVRDAAVAAARRGVRVSLMVDGFGSDAGDAFFAALREAGGHVCRFSPEVGRRYLLRNHQKIALADDGLALIGGFNVEQSYFADGPDGWRDLGLLVDGPAAAPLRDYLDQLMAWAGRPHARMREVNRLIERSSQADGALRWLFGGPTRRLSPWALALKRDMQRARRLDMIAAYFAPNPGLLRRLGRIVTRGGEARVVTAARSDNSMTVAAARHTYARLLRRRVRVFEYQPAMLHTKLYVVDGVSYVGSANCDMRSLFLNMEVMLRIEDAGFADAMGAHVDRELADCQEARPELIRTRAGPWRRLVWRVAYFLVAVADYSVTRRLNFRPGAGIAT